LHLDGEGALRNYMQAQMWFSLAAAKALDKDGRDLVVRNREPVAKTLAVNVISAATCDR
jgi:hypothetical protein